MFSGGEGQVAYRYWAYGWFHFGFGVWRMLVVVLSQFLLVLRLSLVFWRCVLVLLAAIWYDAAARYVGGFAMSRALGVYRMYSATKKSFERSDGPCYSFQST